VTANGKGDKRALPNPEGAGLSSGVEYVAPNSDLEIKLVEVWSALLNIEKDKIGIHDNFFELGGHSLTLIRLVGLTYKEFEVKLKLRDLFQHSDVASQAELIELNNWSSQDMEDTNTEIETINF
jgi:acyl carrier protein